MSLPLYWREPAWLWLAVLPALLSLLVLWRRHTSVADCLDSRLAPWALASDHSFGSRLRIILAWIGWVLLCVALAGPRTPHWLPPGARAAEDRLMLLFDLSASMTARDRLPSRRAAAQALAMHWLDEAPAELAIGVAVYAGHGHLLFPPTPDIKTAQTLLKDLNHLTLPTLGNHLAQGMQIALSALKGGTGKQALIWFSDGDLTNADYAAAEQIFGATDDAMRQDLQLLIIGLGGEEQTRIPIIASGTEVTTQTPAALTRRATSQMRKFANQVGGQYLPWEDLTAVSLEDLLLRSSPKIDATNQHAILWQEWFFLPLLMGITSLLLAIRAPHPRNAIPPLQSWVGWVCVGALLLLLQPQTTWAGSNLDAARRALAEGHYAQARAKFSQAQDYFSQFGEGLACYYLQDYDCARRAFANAAWHASDDALRGRAVFNLGLVYFRLGAYEEAEVLFREAGSLGVAQDKVQVNTSFAHALALSVRKEIADLARARKRAEFRAQAKDMPADMLERLAAGMELPAAPHAEQPLYSTDTDLQALIARGVALAQANAAISHATEPRSWAKTPSRPPPDSPMALYTRLLPLEIGLPGVPEQPRRIPNQRAW